MTQKLGFCVEQLELCLPVGIRVGVYNAVRYCVVSFCFVWGGVSVCLFCSLRQGFSV